MKIVYIIIMLLSVSCNYTLDNNTFAENTIVIGDDNITDNLIDYQLRVKVDTIDIDIIMTEREFQIIRDVIIATCIINDKKNKQ